MSINGGDKLNRVSGDIIPAEDKANAFVKEVRMGINESTSELEQIALNFGYSQVEFKDLGLTEDQIKQFLFLRRNPKSRESDERCYSKVVNGGKIQIVVIARKRNHFSAEIFSPHHKAAKGHVGGNDFTLYEMTNIMREASEFLSQESR